MTTLLVDHHWYLFSRGRLLPYALFGVGFTFIGYKPDEPFLGETIAPSNGISSTAWPFSSAAGSTAA